MLLSLDDAQASDPALGRDLSSWPLRINASDSAHLQDAYGDNSQNADDSFQSFVRAIQPILYLCASLRCLVIVFDYWSLSYRPNARQQSSNVCIGSSCKVSSSTVPVLSVPSSLNLYDAHANRLRPMLLNPWTCGSWTWHPDVGATDLYVRYTSGLFLVLSHRKLICTKNWKSC